jgi:hypothetical protein
MNRFVLASLPFLVLVSGCPKKGPPAPPEAGPPADDASADVAAEALASEGEPIFIAPLLVQTPVMSAMAMPGRRGKGVTEDGRKAYRIGYLRVGQRVRAHPEARHADNCPGGWYELLEGGFVCTKWITLDLKSPKARLAPHPPYKDGPLPYEYGLNGGQGTPLYRNVPTHDDRNKLEPWRAPKPAPDESAGAEAPASAEPEPAEPGESAEPAASAAPKPRETKPQDGGVPWYMRDGGKVEVKLDELRERGPVARRMVAGFYVSLDKKFTSEGATWWRTASGLIAPVDRIVPQKVRTEFHGVWIGSGLGAADAGEDDGGTVAGVLDAGGAPWVPLHPISKMPVGIIVSAYGHKYAIDEQKQTVTVVGVAPRFTVVGLTSRTVDLRGHVFRETDDGWWMGDKEGVVPVPGPAPEGLTPGEKWIDVNITHQWLVALEGDRPVYVTLVSSGKKDETNKQRDHRTITGSFHIKEKHISATMDDDTATDGPYSIDDVPWIMYFRRSYALHGAFWHADFGYRKSHGCVNLAPYDAKALFEWTDPKLPDGWHAVFTTPDKPGTRVVVHE